MPTVSRQGLLERRLGLTVQATPHKRHDSSTATPTVSQVFEATVRARDSPAAHDVRDDAGLRTGPAVTASKSRGNAETLAAHPRFRFEPDTHALSGDSAWIAGSC